MAKEAATAQNETKHDGWSNLLTGMGTKADKTRRTIYRGDKGLTEKELDNIYRGDGIGRRTVDVPAREMLRQWIEVDGDPDGKILAALGKLRARKHLAQALRWARLYGGAMIVLGVMDGGKMEEEIRENSISQVSFMRVYGRFQVAPNWSNLIEDPMSDQYGTPIYYQVNPLQGTPYNVHHSRILIFDGEDVSDRVRRENNGWGDSSLQSTYDYLRNLGTGFNSAANILTDFVQATLSVKGLQDLIAGGQEDLVRRRLEIMDLSRSVLNLLLLDENELYDKKASSVAGLADLLDRFMVVMSAATGIPVTKLFGRAPAGLNATGESDTRNWYDDLRAEQEDKLRPQIERLVHLVCISKQGPMGGRIPKDMRVVFLPLWQMDDVQEAEYRLKVAQTDEVYIRNQVLDPEEVAVSRFGGDVFSAETTIDVSTRENGKEGGAEPATGAPATEEPSE